MRNILLITTTILALLLSGCGHDTPEEVAEAFAGAMSSADMDEAKELVSKDALTQITRLKKACSEEERKKLYEETFEVLNAIDRKSQEKQFTGKVKEILGQLEKDIKILQQRIEKEVKDKYGSPKSIPKNQRETMMNDALQKLTNVVDPTIKKLFDVLEIKTVHTEEVRGIISEFMIKGGNQMRVNRRNRYVLQDIVQETVLKREGGIDQKCVLKYTEFGNIAEINFIETMQKSPDVATVRLELIGENGKSNKVSVRTEKIKNEWKISTFRVNTFF